MIDRAARCLMALLLTGRASACAPLYFNNPREYDPAVHQVLCLEATHDKGASATIEAEVLDVSLKGSRICLSAEYRTTSTSAASFLSSKPMVRQVNECGTGRVLLSVPQEVNGLLTVLPSLGDATAGTRIVVVARVQSGGALYATTPAVGPPPAAPQQPTSGSYCLLQESRFVSACHDDMMRLCPDAPNTEAVMKCVDENREEASQTCLDSMHEFSECLYGPRLLVPMQIASFLLLATASVVLLCTLLRCCCRYVRLSSGSLAQLDGAAEEVEHSEDDDEPTVTPLPTGVKRSEGPSRCCETQMDEDVPPTYTEVVEGAAVAMQAATTTQVTTQT